MNSKAQNVTGPIFFALITVSIYGTVIFATSSSWMIGPKAGVLSRALVMDLLITVPALYYFFFIRKRKWPLITLLPFVLLNVYGAVLLISDVHVPSLRYASYLIFPLEIGLMAFIGIKVHQGIVSFRQSKTTTGVDLDVFSLIRKTTRRVVAMPRVAEVLAFEIGIIYAAIFLKTDEGRAGGFSSHLKPAYAQLFWSLFCVMLIELIVVHLFLWVLGLETLAWVLSGLSLYGLIWLIGDYKAIKWNRIRFDNGNLMINIGFRWRIAVPIDDVEFVKKISYKDVQRRGRMYLNTSLFGQPALEICLKRELEAVGVYGIRKHIKCIGLQVDEPAVFYLELEKRGVRIADSNINS